MTTTLNLGATVRTLDGGTATVDDTSAHDPVPLVWPVCERCEAPYVLRLCHLFGTSGITRSWCWQRDCEKPRSTCKGAGITLHDADGEVPPDGR